MYDFNLLVSCPWALAGRARREIDYLVKQLGDDDPVIRPTIARGIIGVKTRLDSREVVEELKTLFEKDPNIFQFTLKWVPVDLWVDSDIEAMKEAVAQIKDKIKLGERWRMTVEKRRSNLYHTIDIIKALADLINEKVGLKNPDKILRLDIIGKSAGLSVVTPQEIFSTTRLAS
jgi:tRNA acetyltransferase TAN1